MWRRLRMWGILYGYDTVYTNVRQTIIPTTLSYYLSSIWLDTKIVLKKNAPDIHLSNWQIRPTQAWCQPSWQPGLTTVTQSSQAFHNLRLIHFNVSRMRRPGLLQEQERGTTSLQSSRAYTGFRSGSALSTSSACSCTWCELVAALRTCRTWWHPSLTCLVVRDWDPPAASDMNFHGWN